MPTTDPWYEAASPDVGLTQGDTILRCPVEWLRGAGGWTRRR
jgi:hypothetical protein